MRPDLLEKTSCHDCAAKPGVLHSPGCDVERCPRCGGQIISCECFTDDTWPKDEERLIWTGIWPGCEEAIELGLWSKWIPNERFEADEKCLGLEAALSRLGGEAPGRWAICDKDDPKASPDLNRLPMVAVWDAKAKRFVKR